MSGRLTSLGGLPADVILPGYVPESHGTGIVHIGLGAFHKAHQAFYTDIALANAGGDWRIIGVSLRRPEAADQLRPQNGLYTLIERGGEGSRARIIGSIAMALFLRRDRQAVLDALIAPETRIVSVTVTEKGYGLNRTSGCIDPEHPAIAHDLATPDNPEGVVGLLVWALAARKSTGVPPFTVLCCDNLPENGRMLQALLVDFARQTAPHLVEHIADHVAFPSTMVDRITPASTDHTLRSALEMTGHNDAAAVETEAFSQWVIEDCFPDGRPAWERAGVLFVDDVRPFEEMKLRMLNGTHSMLAYAGFLSGHRYVAEVMRDHALSTLVCRHMKAAAATLPPLRDVDLSEYSEALIERFSNPHLRHETYQIAMDGTEKLPQRILAPALKALKAGQGFSSFAFATAAWMRYTLGFKDDGERYALRDPQEERIATRVGGARTAAEVVGGLFGLPGLFPDDLVNSNDWRRAVTGRLRLMMEMGMPRAFEAELSDVREDLSRFGE